MKNVAAPTEYLLIRLSECMSSPRTYTYRVKDWSLGTLSQPRKFGPQKGGGLCSPRIYNTVWTDGRIYTLWAQLHFNVPRRIFQIFSLCFGQNGIFPHLSAACPFQ